MPCNQDLYFRTKDNEIEVNYIPNVSLRPYNSLFGIVQPILEMTKILKQNQIKIFTNYYKISENSLNISVKNNNKLLFIKYFINCCI